jgi:hypothetical protein
MAEPDNRTLPSDPLPSQLRFRHFDLRSFYWRFSWYVPMRIRTAGRFHAADPWNGNLPTEFSIQVYWRSDVAIWLPASGTPADSQLLDMFGIRSEIDGHEHMLPSFLSELWQTHRIAAEALPRLLISAQPLPKRDYLPFWRRSRRIQRALAALALVSIGVLVWGIANLPPAGHRPLRMSAQAWLDNPLRDGQAVEASSRDDKITIEGVIADEVWDLRFPDGVWSTFSDPGEQRYILLSARARGERRLLLAAGWERDYVRIILKANDPQHDPAVAVGGITLGVESLGLTAQRLQVYKTSLPDLNITQVFCLAWRWRDALLSDSVWVALFIAGELVITCACIGVWLTWRVRRARRQMDWALTQTGPVAAAGPTSPSAW